MPAHKTDTERALEAVVRALETALAEARVALQAEQNRRLTREERATRSTPPEPMRFIRPIIGKCTDPYCKDGRIVIAGVEEECSTCDGNGNMRG